MLDTQIKLKKLIIFSFAALAIFTLFSLPRYSPAATFVEPEAVQAANLNARHKPDVQKRYRRLAAYRVQPGDSLYWIAGSYGISVAQLRKINGLKEDVIR